MAPAVEPHGAMWIGRWRSRHLVAADHPAPDRVRERVDDAIRRDVAAALAGVAELAAPNPDELVLVRRLEMDVTVNAGWDRGAIAKACARALSRHLLIELTAGSSDNVIRFSSRAEIVAAYVATRALGDGPLPWFLDRFRGWTSLPRSAAIRAALCEAPEDGAAALSMLSPAALTAAALTLEAADVETIVHTLPRPGLDDDARRALRRVLRLAADNPPPDHVLHRPGAVIWLAGRAGDRAGWATLRTAARIACLVLRAGRGVVPLAAALAAAAGDDRLIGAAISAIGDDLDRSLHLASAVAHVLDQVEGTGATVSRSTRFGGGFLLLDDWQALGLPALTRDWPAPGATESANGALVLVTLGACLGSGRSHAFVEDPLWRDLFGVPPQVDRAALAAWLTALGPARALGLLRMGADEEWHAPADDAEHDEDSVWPGAPDGWREPLAAVARALLGSFARRLPGFARSSAPFLRGNFLDVAARLDEDADRIVVTLTRPALALVLNLTGRNRGERRWPWIDPRPFVLFSEG